MKNDPYDVFSKIEKVTKKDLQSKLDTLFPFVIAAGTVRYRLLTKLVNSKSRVALPRKKEQEFVSSFLGLKTGSKH